jgi:MraZ protein
MFFGKYVLPLNEKKQLTLPSNYQAATSAVAYLTQGFDRNLVLVPQATFDKLYSHVKDISITDPLARLLGRLFLGSAVELQVNTLGQVEIPHSLCEFAGLTGEVVVVGQGEYMELWSPDQWETQSAGLLDYAANAQRFEKFDLSFA